MKSNIVRTIWAVTLTVAAQSWAAPATFTVNPDLSVVAVSATAASFALSEQAPGSLGSKLGGTLVLDQAGDFIQFTGGSQLIVYTNGNWEPGLGGVAGTAPACFGGKVSSFLANAKAALRNAQLDATSPPLKLTSGSFDSSTLVFGFLPAAKTAFDYSVSALFGNPKTGSATLTGLSTNHVTASATLTTAAGVQTLTIPVDATFIMGLLADGDSTVDIKGKIVATRAASTPVAFSIGQVGVKGQTVTLQWKADPGQKFTILGSGDLKTWNSRATDVTSTTGDYSWSGATAGNTEFLRLTQ